MAKLALLLLLGSCAGLFGAQARAQEPFPGEPAQLPPQQQQQLPPQEQQPAEAPQAAPQPLPDPGTTIRVNTNIVLVPTLVEKPSGEVIYGLNSRDFTLDDNGVQQNIHVDDDLDSQPVSIVVAVQRGRSAALEFDKIAKLGTLLQLFLGDGHGKAALVVFDSHATYLEGFTSDTETITRDLQRLQPGDGGAAILDAVGTSVDILEQRPPDQRRILLLISESRDHGSHKVTAKQLVQRIGTSNTLVIGLTYSPSKATLLDDLRGSAHGDPVGNTGDLLAPLMMAIAAVHKNVSKELAVMSGGEYASFTREKGFEDRIAEVASHARNRYILSFHPKDLTPGLHQISVKLNQDYGARVVARTSYWAVNDAAAPQPQ
ncbi:MAG: VWA domain-containing protein [Acidobacteria bacterium]|nr:VWA domain-containing protein [Acidobacteriota bacterium]